MDVSIVHSGVRVRPDLVVEVAALIDGRPVLVDLERDAIDRLLGQDVSDEKALHSALRRNIGAIRIAIEAYVFARGLPLDQHVVLFWRDFSSFADAPVSNTPLALDGAINAPRD